MLILLAAITFVRHFLVQIAKFRMAMSKFVFLASGSLNWITVQDSCAAEDWSLLGCDAGSLAE